MPNDQPTSRRPPSTDLAWIIAAAQQQPDDTRRVITLRYVYGLNKQEVCQHLQMTPDVVDAHLIAAAKAIADAYEHRIETRSHHAPKNESQAVLDLQLRWRT